VSLPQATNILDLVSRWTIQKEEMLAEAKRDKAVHEELLKLARAVVT